MKGKLKKILIAMFIAMMVVGSAFARHTSLGACTIQPRGGKRCPCKKYVPQKKRADGSWSDECQFCGHDEEDHEGYDDDYYDERLDDDDDYDYDDD